MNWTIEQFRAYATKRLRDEQRTRTKLYEAANPSVGAIPNPERKRDIAPALDRGAQARNTRGRSVAYRVSIISFRRKLLDGDNLIAGSKWLRDSIARKLGRDDAEGKGIEFEYFQQITRGEQGTLVKIEQL